MPYVTPKRINIRQTRALLFGRRRRRRRRRLYLNEGDECQRFLSIACFLLSRSRSCETVRMIDGTSLRVN